MRAYKPKNSRNFNNFLRFLKGKYGNNPHFRPAALPNHRYIAQLVFDHVAEYFRSEVSLGSEVVIPKEKLADYRARIKELEDLLEGRVKQNVTLSESADFVEIKTREDFEKLQKAGNLKSSVLISKELFGKLRYSVLASKQGEQKNG